MASEQEYQARQQQLLALESTYHDQQRQERPTSRLPQARQRLHATAQRLRSRQQTLLQAQRRLAKTTARWHEQQAQLACSSVSTALNTTTGTNRDPVEAEFRWDAGFGTYDNIALLIEMGYEVYTKPHSHRVVTFLRQHLDDQSAWVRVGANAELVAWSNRQLQGCPYPVDVALERFYTGATCKHSALLHFGTDPVTHALSAWFEQYNARQTIEAGIKESKQVFYLHHIKARAEPAIYMQECFVTFAANFIRWATHW
jgi:hypothetical protein